MEDIPYQLIGRLNSVKMLISLNESVKPMQFHPKFQPTREGGDIYGIDKVILKCTQIYKGSRIAKQQSQV